ncbi:MAG: FAD-binding oxidoreductase [Chloroflexi bacterium]|nr:FAD-binding oxidoreductase [Chloroflexota bacterium]
MPFNKTAEVVVIGGGCNGTSTALHLAKRGVKNVVLVEKKYITSGATQDSAGNLRPYAANEITARILQKNIDIFKNFDQIIGGNCGHVQTGRIWAVAAKRKKVLETAVANCQQWGIKVKMIPLEEAQERLPQVNLEDIGATAYFEEAGNCDPVATTNAYAARARDLGVSIHEETEVTGIKVRSGKISAVVTSRGEIATPVVVNVAGFFSDRVGKMVGLDIPISPQRQQNIVLRRPYDFIGIFPIFHDGINEYMFKPQRHQMDQLIGAWRTLMQPPEVVNPDSYRTDIDPEFRARSLEVVYHRFPVLKRGSYRGGATGVYDMSPDASPIFGPVPEVGGFYCHCGWSGLGFETSPLMGDLMAELITTGKTTFLDTSLYRLSRFKEGKLHESDWFMPED